MATPWHMPGAALDELLRRLNAFDHLILAVSGGPDSMALMHLVARWANADSRVRPMIEVATVDHGLRPQSRQEAAEVGRRARSLGFAHHILTWPGPKPATGVQAAAREMRYALLADLAQTSSGERVGIVTAHTIDDQGETVLMRLARGSGADGLAAMREVRRLDEAGRVWLVRPLLGLSKGDLATLLRDEGLDWHEDPSNGDQRFERVRLRHLQGALDSAGLTPSALALTAKRMARAADALEQGAECLMRDGVDLVHGAFARVDPQRFGAAPEELRVRVLSRLLGLFGGSTPRAGLQQVESLVERLQRDRDVSTTLGGCVVRACSRQIRVLREASRIPQVDLPLALGATAIWDGRFKVSLAAWPEALGSYDQCEPIVVRALDPGTLRLLRGQSATKARIPSRAALSLPAFWWGGRLVDVPAIELRGRGIYLARDEWGLQVAADFLAEGGTTHGLDVTIGQDGGHPTGRKAT